MIPNDRLKDACKDLHRLLGETPRKESAIAANLSMLVTVFNYANPDALKIIFSSGLTKEDIGKLKDILKIKENTLFLFDQGNKNSNEKIAAQLDLLYSNDSLQKASSLLDKLNNKEQMKEIVGDPNKLKAFLQALKDTRADLGEINSNLTNSLATKLLAAGRTVMENAIGSQANQLLSKIQNTAEMEKIYSNPKASTQFAKELHDWSERCKALNTPQGNNLSGALLKARDRLDVISHAHQALATKEPSEPKEKAKLLADVNKSIHQCKMLNPQNDVSARLISKLQETANHLAQKKQEVIAPPAPKTKPTLQKTKASTDIKSDWAAVKIKAQEEMKKVKEPAPQISEPKRPKALPPRPPRMGNSH